MSIDDKTQLVVTRWINASPARLFRAWTDEAELQAWWGPAGITCNRAEIDLRVGGKYVIGNDIGDNQTVVIEGEFVLIDPPHQLVFTWLIAGNEAAELVTVTFEPAMDGTDVTICHEKIGSEQSRARHLDGWLGCLDGLVAHVAFQPE
jgi:uncharacterized protein YndB with AHSA1/START domain